MLTDSLMFLFQRSLHLAPFLSIFSASCFFCFVFSRENTRSLENRSSAALCDSHIVSPSLPYPCEKQVQQLIIVLYFHNCNTFSIWKIAPEHDVFPKFIWVSLFKALASLQHKQILMKNVRKNEGLSCKKLIDMFKINIFLEFCFIIIINCLLWSSLKIHKTH